MSSDDRRFVVRGRDLRFIYEQIESAKERLEHGTPERNELERAEARFQSLALFAKDYRRPRESLEGLRLTASPGETGTASHDSSLE